MAKRDEFLDEPTQEEIAKRAYELYLQRGSAPGYELDDWLAAKADLTAAGSPRLAIDNVERLVKGTSDELESPDDTRRNGGDHGAGRRAVRQTQSHQ